VFNVVNQTKLISTAFLAYFMLGKRQSRQQCFALFLLFVASILISLSTMKPKTIAAAETLTTGDGVKFSLADLSNTSVGLICISLASLLSGLGSALSEFALRRVNTGQPRDTYLFSAELALYSSLCMLVVLVFDINGDRSKGMTGGFGRGLDKFSTIPIITQAIGGVLVGLVTKYAGSVRKGFSIVLGILIAVSHSVFTLIFLVFRLCIA
jgi:solute carrier family 35 (UDP-sugar transporter), member A1/2/3